MSYALITSVLALPVAGCILGAVTAEASASFTTIEADTTLSTEGLADFMGTLDYQFLGGNQGQLTVTLTNTTDASVGGYLTAFMFRMPRELGGFSVALLRSSQPGMARIPPGTKGAPFLGVWQAGVGTGGEWQGGGTPTAGVAPGDTGAWAFLVSGTGAAALTAERLMSDGSMPDPYAFVVRFRGIGAGHSDKVPALMPDHQRLRMAALAEAVEQRR